MATSCSLLPWLYFAAVDDEGVILDLSRDRYLGLTGPSALVWSCLDQGLTFNSVVAKLAATESIDLQSARDFVSRQIDAWAVAGLVAWGMSRALLKFGGGSVEILRDVLH